MRSVTLLAGIAALAWAAPSAHAQLGSAPNVPPQHLFNTDQPPRLNDGLGTMAAPEPKPAAARHVRRRIRH